MTDTFEIGTTIENMATLKSLGLPNPLDEPVSCSDIRELADGSTLEVGWGICNWHWDFVQANDYKNLYTVLKNFFPSKNVTLFIKTRDSDDVYKTYQVLATFPTNKEWSTGNRLGRKVFDFNISFRRMILVEEETS